MLDLRKYLIDINLDDLDKTFINNFRHKVKLKYRLEV